MYNSVSILSAALRSQHYVEGCSRFNSVSPSIGLCLSLDDQHPDDQLSLLCAGMQGLWPFLQIPLASHRNVSKWDLLFFQITTTWTLQSQLPHITPWLSQSCGNVQKWERSFFCWGRDKMLNISLQFKNKKIENFSHIDSIHIIFILPLPPPTALVSLLPNPIQIQKLWFFN